MNGSLANASSSYYVTVRGERFTCGGVTGLGPQGDLGLPGQVLTVTLDDCVLTDAPGARDWALSAEAPAEPCHIKIEEVRPGAVAPLTTWYLTDARPDTVTDHSTTATSHETRIGRLTLHAAKISPDMP
ncbi:MULTISPECIES: hypothetical protein [unclassified Streptomyces]|uniref:hypothetical protein n=1 Tax=unclassified Streptomyces TaxID=2593676 RepID=UPI000DC76314|nr:MULTISPECIES: hypothetical protein [unclassified Streptomyces]AWZ06046.1 hypothetical protein DRB89_17035 [Streptomyces sp. ICC4]AWZ13684.1 hypothetical protein DRB96_16785 [Streptomyces sp. ICC1]